jgi:hypothetical protein
MFEDAAMKRRTIGLLVTLALSLLVVPLAAGEEPAQKMSRVGLVSIARDPPGPRSSWRPFLEAMGAIIATGDPVTFLRRKRVVQAALQNRLPGIYWAREYVQEGGPMTYSANIDELRRRAATYVDKILKGAKSADLPVEQPMKSVGLYPPSPAWKKRLPPELRPGSRRTCLG